MHQIETQQELSTSNSTGFTNMPTSKIRLDLEAWSNFMPKERQNDFEYNLLLHKFRSLYNEVKDFQKLHSNCSVTKADILRATVDSSKARKSSLDDSGNHIQGMISNFESTSNGIKNVIDRKSYFQHQNSVPTYSIKTEKNVIQTNDSKQRPNRDHGSLSHQTSFSQGPKHYNSSHNLLMNNNPAPNHDSNSQAPSRPEIKQRGQIIQSRFMLSKSSERLDTIGNNHQVSILTDVRPEDRQTTEIVEPVVGETKSFLDDPNIYDAVSPDDTPNISIDNLNPNDPSQSYRRGPNSFGLTSESCEILKALSPPRLNQSSRTPNDTNDRERSNNSFGSSIILDTSNNNKSSSHSLLSGMPNKERSESPQYANYVNIDYFLRRGDSPSMDCLDDSAVNADSSDVSDDDEDDDDDDTQMSQSFSSDQICEEALRDMNMRELTKKLSSKINITSSSSITPASSGDFLEDHPSSSIVSPCSASSRFHDANHKISSFFSSNNRDNDYASGPKSSTSPRDSSKVQPAHNLGPIYEAGGSFITRQLNTDSIRSEGENENALAEAHTTMRSFLSDLNLSPVDDVFEDKAQRRIVKESFAVEFSGRRKLRHLFLFNDVIVCAKYQASSKQKFTFDVKWYLILNGVSILDPNDVNNHVKYDKEAVDNQILAIRTNLMLLRSQLQQVKRSKHKQPSKVIKKLKKKRTELEAELVLLLPHLPLVIKHSNGKKYTFFLSSNFDRNQWIESIKFLQTQLPPKVSSMTPSSSELQAWIQTCRKNLNPSLGTFLLRSNCDDDLLYGDLYVQLISVVNITRPGIFHFCFEVDSYGHFSQKSSTPILKIDNPEHNLNDEYIFQLDGAHTLRVLLYEDLGLNSKPSFIGKSHVELSRAWFLEKPVDKIINFSSICSLVVKLSYSSSELSSMRIPHAKLCPTFGLDITQVCKKEKTNVPLLIQLCINEVERRGMREVGIYRMSGTSTDIHRLKKAFETNPYVAELLLRDIDINSVTGFLKTYLREIPEGLFINKLYLKFVAAFNIPQSDSSERAKMMLELFKNVPVTNQHTIIFLVEHLIKVNKYESYNKMSLTNLATVIGPNILRPPTESSGPNASDPFTAVVIGSMSQAGILYFFLNRKYQNLPLTELDPSEIPHSVRN